MSDANGDNLGEEIPRPRPTGPQPEMHSGLMPGDWVKLSGVIVAVIGLVGAGMAFAFYPRANAATLETTVRMHIEAQAKADEKLDKALGGIATELKTLTTAVQSLKTEKRKRGDHE